LFVLTDRWHNASWGPGTSLMSKEKAGHIEKEQVELICPDCHLPIAGQKPRTDVTRYLSEISRCQCKRDAQTDNNGESESAGTRKAIAIKVGFSTEDASEILGDRFEVLSFLGQGGMGSVFKVKERRTEKIFAVKLLNPQLVNDEHSVRRFEQEAKAAMHLTHSSLAAVYEYGLGKDHNTPFLVMDYLEGSTLDQVLKKEEYLDYRRALDIFIQLCEAVSYAHLHGVIHRDIKPNNIMVRRTDHDVEMAKLFDFGIAKVLPNQAIDFTQDMTQTGDLFGSPLYMSPEQCKGLAVDERTDIYALGCVMYKALNGAHPFEGKNFVDTVVNIITKEAQPLSKISTCDLLPPMLEQVVMRCLSKDPQYRYKNAALLQADLENVRDKKPISKMQSEKQVGHQSYVRDKIVLALIAFVITAGLGVGAFFLSNGNHPPGRSLDDDPVKLAQDLDNRALACYSSNDPAVIKRAIPLLQYGAATYKGDGSYAAENIAHVGKVYLKLANVDPASKREYLEKAVPNYREGLKLFQQWGNYNGSQMPMIVGEYREVLIGLNRPDLAEAMMKDFSKNNTLTTIPDPLEKK
jgi:serine/threonine protein kinase